jgi:hypothetical protein
MRGTDKLDVTDRRSIGPAQCYERMSWPRQFRVASEEDCVVTELGADLQAAAEHLDVVPES